MAYEKGDVEIRTIEEHTSSQECSCDPGHHCEDDNRADAMYSPTAPPWHRPGTFPLPHARLDHSCDYWIIGGPSEIRAMIEDLKWALREMEAPSEPDARDD